MEAHAVLRAASVDGGESIVAAESILVFQTAFIGDVILTTPMIRVLHREKKDALIDVVAVPSGASLLANHPAVHGTLVYDKKGMDWGLRGALALIRTLRRSHYDAAIIPHRSLRSGLICYLAGIPRRIGFSTSAAKFLMTHVVEYHTERHEVERNLSLLQPFQIFLPKRELPQLFPSTIDREVVDMFLGNHPTISPVNMIAVAPGSEWVTKRWLAEGYIELAKKLLDEQFSVVLVGGKSDLVLCREIESAVGSPRLLNVAGEFTLLQSAELIHRCKLIVSNDSAPMHIGVAMRTPVVAIFGATVPEFGFAPLGEHDVVVQTMGLPCRPCSIHGGNACPIKTFVCMRNISSDQVLERVHSILSTMNAEVSS